MTTEIDRTGQAEIAALQTLYEAKAKLLSSSQAMALKQKDVQFHISRILQISKDCRARRRKTELDLKLLTEKRECWMTTTNDLPELSARIQFLIDITSGLTPNTNIDNVPTEAGHATDGGTGEVTGGKVTLLKSMVALSKQATSLLEAELLHATNTISLTEKKLEVKQSQKAWRDARTEYQRLSLDTAAAQLEVKNAEETLQAWQQNFAVKVKLPQEPPLKTRWQRLREEYMTYPSGVWSKHIINELREIHEECRPLIQILNWADDMRSSKEGAEFYGLFANLLKRVSRWDTSQINLYFSHDEEGKGRYARMKEVYVAAANEGRV